MLSGPLVYLVFKKVYGGVRIPEAERVELESPAPGLTPAGVTMATIEEA